MNLIERKKAEHRERLMQRIGAVLVTMSLLLSLAAPPPAKAVVVADDIAIAALVAAFLASCGITLAATNMDTSGVAEQTNVLVGKYLNEKQGGKSAQEWLGGETMLTQGLNWVDDQLGVNAFIASKLSDLARWVVGKYGVEPETEISIYSFDGGGFVLADGTKCLFSNMNDYYEYSVNYHSGTNLYPLLLYNPVVLQNGVSIVFDRSNSINIYDIKHNLIYSHNITIVSPLLGFFIFVKSDGSGFFKCIGDNSHGNVGNGNNVSYDTMQRIFSDSLSGEENLLLNNSVISIPDIQEDDTREIFIVPDVAQGLTYDQMLQAILEAIAAGQLSAERTDEKEKEKEQEEEKEKEKEDADALPDVAELGLPELGATLTTRFPFSIPWDIARGIKLLAAPPKTPRFEVDFFAPIKYRFGGSLGDTTIVLDFSDYEIVGQVSRWASTIGFCLLLASGTKKLIWTA